MAGGGLLENQADDSETGVAKWVGGYVSLQELMIEPTEDGKHLMRHRVSSGLSDDPCGGSDRDGFSNVCAGDLCGGWLAL